MSNNNLANEAQPSVGKTTIPRQTNMWDSSKQATRKLSSKLGTADLLRCVLLAPLCLSRVPDVSQLQLDVVLATMMNGKRLLCFLRISKMTSAGQPSIAPGIYESSVQTFRYSQARCTCHQEHQRCCELCHLASAFHGTLLRTMIKINVSIPKRLVFTNRRLGCSSQLKFPKGLKWQQIIIEYI